MKPCRHSPAPCSTLKCTEQKPVRKASLCCNFRDRVLCTLDQTCKSTQAHAVQLLGLQWSTVKPRTRQLSSNVGEAHAFAILIHRSIKILICLLQLHEFREEN